AASSRCRPTPERATLSRERASRVVVRLLAGRPEADGAPRSAPRDGQGARPEECAGMPVPARPRIYHITHVETLTRIAADGVLWSDAVMVRRGGPAVSIGMSAIKQRRLRELRVTCHPETFVGEYVPFYFCPRSIMLYLVYMANHPELTYRGGQEPIVHL